MNPAGKVPGEIGLARGDRLGIEDVAFDAILARALEIAQGVVERGLGAKHLDPADLPQELAGISAESEGEEEETIDFGMM